MIAYVDASVVLRLVLGQPHALREWRSIDTAVASALVEVECLRTLDRLRLRGGVLLDRDLAVRREAVFELLRRFEVVAVERPVLARAALPLPTTLGTLDAIHLATAALWRETQGAELAMATHDTGLGTAARASGFSVIGVA
jgi:predicted nucleic acid-binding protein